MLSKIICHYLAAMDGHKTQWNVQLISKARNSLHFSVIFRFFFTISVTSYKINNNVFNFSSY